MSDHITRIWYVILDMILAALEHISEGLIRFGKSMTEKRKS